MAVTATLSGYANTLPFERVEFETSDKTILRGNLYTASQNFSSAPVIIFCHGLGLVKEQYLENWFRHFVAAGYHVLAYDHRYWGHSDGMPRRKFDWQGQSEDLIDAVTYVRSLPQVDDRNVFLWGVAHAGSVVAMAAANDKRTTGIVMFLPCIDGAWDKGRWGEWLWEKVQSHRFNGPRSAIDELVTFWPLTDSEAAGTGGSVLSGDYIQQWSTVAKQMAEQDDNEFDGRLTLSSFWNDFNTRPMDFFDKIAPTPLLWVMATEDVVCGPLEFTRGVYDKLTGPKEILVLEGEHLAQYFDPGFPRSVNAMLDIVHKYRID